MKIATYTIAGAGDEDALQRMEDSAAEADHVIVVPTYPTSLWSAWINISPFRFDDARNAALALVPADVDVCIALDCDETLEPGWREALEAVALPAAPWSAWVSFDFNGEVFQQNNRVHSRHGWRWKHPCHEALVPSMQSYVAAISVPNLRITHRPDMDKKRPNYLDLLAWGQWEEPNSTRMLHYYGRELMFNGYYKDALERFEKYLRLEPQAPFPAERAQTIVYAKQCLEKIK